MYRILKRGEQPRRLMLIKIYPLLRIIFSCKMLGLRMKLSFSSMKSKSLLNLNKNERKIPNESLRMMINGLLWRKSKKRLKKFILGNINRIRRLRSCRLRYNYWSKVCSRLFTILRKRES